MYAHTYIISPQSPPLKGRYFDGDTRCDANGNGTSPACYGFLEATYSYSVDTSFFRNFDLAHDPPVVVLRKPEPSDFPSSLQWSVVRSVHTALMRLHRDQLQALGEARGTALRDKIVETEPSEAVLAVWNSGSVG